MKLLEKRNIGVPFYQMKDGDIAVITAWLGEKYIGRIVQRYNDDLISLGMESGRAWPNLFKYKHKKDESDDSCLVEILPPGTKLEI